MALADEIEGMALLAELKGRGLMAVVHEGELGIAPGNLLTAEDVGRIERLRPVLTRLVQAGERGDLIEPLPELRDWFAGLHPLMQELFWYLARMRAKAEGGTLEEAQRQRVR